MDAPRSMTIKKDKAGLRVLHLIAGEIKAGAKPTFRKQTAPHLIVKICCGLVWFAGPSGLDLRTVTGSSFQFGVLI